MPELPEVETTLRGIKPYIEHQQITHLIIRQYQLRWKIPYFLPKKLLGSTIQKVTRRGKYLILKFFHGSCLIHLGMSGRIRLLTTGTPANKHDHVDIEFANKITLRFTDPRRFGAILWIDDDYHCHPLLAHLGPEPLTHQFNGKYLYQRAQKRHAPIKSLIMNNKIVVGVGNIYACEALFLAGIHPAQSASSLTQPHFDELTRSIKLILRLAIKRGGTTLKDFFNSEGKPGHFFNELKVYGRAGLPCIQCGQKLLAIRIGQRNTFYCNNCQSLK